MKLHYSKNSGFTVLEFLIVLGIILILIAILLPSLGASRDKSFDDKKITDLKTVALGIEQYKQVCGFYPAKIDPLETCSDHLPAGQNLSNFIPDIASYHFNDGNSGYYYTPLAFDRDHPLDCNGFHLGAELKTDITGAMMAGDSNIDSTSDQICNAGGLSSNPIRGTDPKMFDIYH